MRYTNKNEIKPPPKNRHIKSAFVLSFRMEFWKLQNIQLRYQKLYEGPP